MTIMWFVVTFGFILSLIYVPFWVTFRSLLTSSEVPKVPNFC